MKALILGGGAVALLAGAAAVRPAPEIVVGRFVTRLSDREPAQRVNAIRAAERLNGAIVAPGQIFSFNEAVGSWSRDQGYRRAPVSFSGQMVRAWGGGVCQTSTALFNASLLAGLEIVERHAHHYAPTYVAPGRDAAVAFPNIDLRVKNNGREPLRLQAEAQGDRLVITWWGRTARPAATISTRMVSGRAPGTLRLGSGRVRVTNPGKPGFEVVTRRQVGDAVEVWHDNYAVMNRVELGR